MGVGRTVAVGVNTTCQITAIQSEYWVGLGVADGVLVGVGVGVSVGVRVGVADGVGVEVATGVGGGDTGE